MNICRVIITGEVPHEVTELNCVKRFGDDPIKEIKPDSILKSYGNNMIYTGSVSEVIDLLIEKGFDKSTIYWQDLDGYGPDKIFKRS